MKIKEFFSKAQETIKKELIKLRNIFDLRDVFVFSGTGFIAYGIWQIYHPAAFIVTGAILLWIGIRKNGNNLKN